MNAVEQWVIPLPDRTSAPAIWWTPLASLGRSSIIVSALCRDHLQNIPVLETFAGIVHTKYIDTGIIQSFRPDLVAMQDFMVFIGV